VFAIVISEKGGAERRESFDQAEISVGRVQGNDVVLPKGNVSKRHARLLYRDGRFIVTDLNSTNGTYVNRRRISQATIVREGDRVYVGDFVLRIEVAEGASSQEASSGSLSRGALGSTPYSGRGAQPPPERESADGDVGKVRVPAAPKAPATSPRHAATNRDASGALPRAGSQPRGPQRAAAPPSIPSPRSGAAVSTQESPGPETESGALAALLSSVVSAMAEGERESDTQYAQRVESLLERHISRLRESGVIASSVSPETLVRDARAELVDIGPIPALLDDDEVTEITVVRYDHVVALRAGRYVVSDRGFSSDAALRGAVAALCRRAGAPVRAGECLVERSFPGGARMWAAVEPAVAHGALLVIRKPRPVAVGMDELIRAGALSRPMATFLERCVKGRLNILVVSSCEVGSVALTSALSALGGEARVVAVQDLDDIASANANVTALSVAGMRSNAGELVRTAARVPGARLVVELAAPAMTAALIDVIGAGTDGVVALLRAPGLARALTRLPAEVAAAQSGLGGDAALACVASSFEVLVEVRRLADRHYRVTRIAEITGTADRSILSDEIFRFAIDRATGAAVEGRFLASGTVPRVVAELTSQGLSVDQSLFKK
jgi:pilus assembly protein CpaF